MAKTFGLFFLDILPAIDAGDLSALVLVELSAAFDTVDHNIPTRQLKTFYMVCLL